MNPYDPKPFANLTPMAVLDAAESAGLVPDGACQALNSYENRVFWIGLEGPQEHSRAAVLKFYRPQRWTSAQILEEHAFLRELQEEEIPAVAPIQHEGKTLFQKAGFRFAAFECRSGRCPDASDFLVLERLGAYIGRIHMVGARTPFASRPHLDPRTFGQSSIEFLCGSERIPPEALGPWKKAACEALAMVQGIWQSCSCLEEIRLHGDAHLGNILWRDEGAHFVDFDDSRMGPAIQDLWMFLPADRAEQTAVLDALLGGYETFRGFPRSQLRLIEPLRTLRLLHYSAWIARRWDDPAFPAAFPWFETPGYWQERTLELQQQCEAMQRPALMV